MNMKLKVIPVNKTGLVFHYVRPLCVMEMEEVLQITDDIFVAVMKAHSPKTKTESEIEEYLNAASN